MTHDAVDDELAALLSGLDSRSEGALAWDVLAILLAARGPITTGDLATMLDVPSRRIRAAAESLDAFRRSDQTLAIPTTHTGSRIAAELSVRERQVAYDRLAAWCARQTNAEWPGDVSDYVLEHGSAHIAHAGDERGLQGLLTPRWLRLRAAGTGAPWCVADDATKVVEAAGGARPPDWRLVFDGALVRAAIVSIADRVPPTAVATLVRAGHDACAPAYADLLSQAAERTRAQREIAQALLDRGLPDGAEPVALRALATALTVADPLRRHDGLSAIAPVLARLGRLAEARRAAVAARAAVPEEGHYLRQTALIRVARALAAAGAIEEAVAASLAAGERTQDRALWDAAEAASEGRQVALAVATAERIQDEWPRVGALKAIAVSLARNGHTGEACAVLDAIEDQARRASASAEVAVALATAGLSSEALRTVESMPEDEAKVTALLDIAVVLCHRSQGDQGRQAAEAALRLVNASAGGARRAAKLMECAATLVQPPTLDLAVRTAQEVLAIAAEESYEPDRAEVLIGVVEPLLRGGLPDAAAAAARLALAAVHAYESRGRIDARRMAELLGRSAVALARSSRPEAEVAAGRARAAARSLHEIEQKPVLVDVAIALVLSGRPDQAQDVLASIENEWSRNEAMTEVAGRLAGSGLLSHAQDMAMMATTYHQERGLEAIVCGAAASGRVDELDGVLSRIDERSQTRILGKQITALSAAGRVDHALELARLSMRRAWPVRAPSRRVDALAAATAALAQAGLGDEANRLGREVLAAAGVGSIALATAAMLVELAAALTDATAAELALDLVALALEALGTDPGRTPDPMQRWRRALVVGKSAQTLVRCGRWDEACQLAQDVADDQDRVSALYHMAIALRMSRAGETRAHELVRDLRALAGTIADDRALTSVANALALLGRADEAVQALEEIADAARRARGLVTVAGDLADRGELERAIELVDGALTLRPDDDGGEYWQETLMNAAKVLASAGRHEAIALVERGLAIVPGPESYWSWSAVLAPGASALARAGQIERAMEVVEAIVDPFQRDVVLKELASILLSAGNLPEALATVMRIEFAPFRCEAIAELVSRAVDSGDTDRALELTALAVAGASAGGHDAFFASLDSLLSMLLSVAGDEWVVAVTRSLIEVDSWWSAIEGPPTRVSST